MGAIAKKDIKDLGAVHYTSGHHKVPRIWIVIADRSIAKIFSKAGASLEMIGEAVPSKDGAEDPQNREMGRTKGAAEKFRNIKYEPSMSASRRNAFKFAHEIAHWLDNALVNEAFDRLIFVAPPQTLGDLRQAASKAVASRLIAEINKDLTHLSEKDLHEGLEKITWF